MLRLSPVSTLFLYTTLFRSRPVRHDMWGLRLGLTTRAVAISASRVARNRARVKASLAARRWMVKVSLQDARSEEHTSELQSLRHLVCRLLLEKKKKKQKQRL